MHLAAYNMHSLSEYLEWSHNYHYNVVTTCVSLILSGILAHYYDLFSTGAHYHWTHLILFTVSIILLSSCFPPIINSCHHRRHQKYVYYRQGTRPPSSVLPVLAGILPDYLIPPLLVRNSVCWLFTLLTARGSFCRVSIYYYWHSAQYNLCYRQGIRPLSPVLPARNSAS